MSFVWSPGVTLEEMERYTIIAALRFYHGNRTKAADALELPIRTLSDKLAKYKKAGIEVPEPPKPAGRPSVAAKEPAIA